MTHFFDGDKSGSNAECGVRSAEFFDLLIHALMAGVPRSTFRIPRASFIIRTDEFRMNDESWMISDE